MTPTLVVTGLPGVGKSTLCSMLSDELGCLSLNTGEVLRNHLRDNGVNLRDEISTGDVFVERFGKSHVGDVIADAAVATNAYILDGVRLISILPALTARGRIPSVIYLTVPEEIRRDRFISRTHAEGVTELITAQKLMSDKDRWAGDLDAFRDLSRWQFENAGAMIRLQSFAKAVAFDIKRVPITSVT